jgi:hypothetical protein
MKELNNLHFKVMQTYKSGRWYVIMLNKIVTKINLFRNIMTNM